MSLSYADARTQLRTVTAHDSDTQITDAQINSWFDQEVARVRRDLRLVAPQLYQVLSGTTTLTSVVPFVDLTAFTPAFESVWRVEMQSGSVWVDVPVSDEFEPDGGDLVYREHSIDGTWPDRLTFSPDSLAAGAVVRVAYHCVPTANTVDVPSGFEDVVIMRTAAKVALRCFDDPGNFIALADRTWESQRKAIRRRYGAQPQPGLRLTKGW